MKKIEILDFNSMATFNELTNVNTITLHPLKFYSAATSANSLVVKRQLERLPFVAYVEADLDNEANVGSYTIDGQNRIIFIVSKATVTSECLAREYIVGYIVEYLTTKVAFSNASANPTYDMYVVRGCDDRFVTAYKQSTLTDLVKIIPGLDNTLNADMTGGYVFQIFRNLKTDNTK